MMIYVDADACPVRHIVEDVAKKFKIPVTMVVDVNHIIKSDYSTVITVSKGKDSVDIALINKAVKGDIVVSQDYGVASMALGKGAYAIGNSGMVYDENNIDRLLFERFIHAKVRRAGKSGRGGMVKKRTRADDDMFRMSFEKLCIKILGGTK